MTFRSFADPAKDPASRLGSHADGGDIHLQGFISPRPPGPGGQAVTRGRCNGPAMRLEMLNPRTLWDSANQSRLLAQPASTRFRPIAALAGMPGAAPIDRLCPCRTYCTPPPPDS
ncbi:uncharacterized protein BO87DRAFT_400684 [Aspergillus neoniger CBS 115656]|uniref:Uncharacterized protein n=1 Tax=Aspergillus neoniger (strain CBS 115656) TaxID=1448310 RepID=A0A318YCX0_ASPNB|nr:hypothetical protein BO87DRAFT_400684 [Aspergillus neoniger CBS 115656]PYH30223.1 hypothetical protein BO87DRAFT_400684 [Aspergillus neoniger CBS 115656]